MIRLSKSFPKRKDLPVKMKNSRQQLILKLINEKKIRTHEQLVDELCTSGVNVTQATVSRDIKDLGIVKIPDKDGSIYAAAKQWDNTLQRFAGEVTDVKSASNIVVVHTMPGMASAVAAAIDGEMKKEIVGSLAGDDAIFIVSADTESAELLCSKLKNYFSK